MATQVTQDEIAGTTLGYAQITSNFATTSTTATQVTGLSVTVSVAGGRRVKITVTGRTMLNSTANAYTTITVWDGTVGSGTQLGSTDFQAYAINAETPAILISAPVPSAGSHTYNVGLHVSGGTGTLAATSTAPAFILVELI